MHKCKPNLPQCTKRPWLCVPTSEDNCSPRFEAGWIFQEPWTQKFIYSLSKSTRNNWWCTFIRLQNVCSYKSLPFWWRKLTLKQQQTTPSPLSWAATPPWRSSPRSRRPCNGSRWPLWAKCLWNMERGVFADHFSYLSALADCTPLVYFSRWLTQV